MSIYLHPSTHSASTVLVKARREEEARRAAGDKDFVSGVDAEDVSASDSDLEVSDSDASDLSGFGGSENAEEGDEAGQEDSGQDARSGAAELREPGCDNTAGLDNFANCCQIQGDVFRLTPLLIVWASVALSSSLEAACQP